MALAAKHRGLAMAEPGRASGVLLAFAAMVENEQQRRVLARAAELSARRQ